MDPIDPGQEQERSPEHIWDLTPSSKGRQRRKNPRYSDYETDDTSTVQTSPRKSLRGRGAASRRTPAKTEDAEDVAQQATDGEEEAMDKTPRESDGKTSEGNPRKSTRAKKTPSKRTPAKRTPKRTPAKKTPAKKSLDTETPDQNVPCKNPPDADGCPPAAGGGVEENGTPKPKRKYVRKRSVQEVTEPPRVEAAGERPAEPEEEEVEPGGRRRRGAAKAALKYLHILAKEVLKSDSQPDASQEVHAVAQQKRPTGGRGRRGQKRKRFDSEGDAEDDEDFVPGAEEHEVEDMDDEEEEEEEEGAEDSDAGSDLGTSRRSPPVYYVNKSNTGSNAKTPNGLTVNMMNTVWSSIEITKKFREEHYSSWVFPEWVPSAANWPPVPQSDLEKYLPQELQSAAFTVRREGLGEDETPPQRLDRFSALPAHPDRWDMLLYAGGPVWAMEWCPTPDGAPAAQHVALACHRGMDDQHHVNRTYGGPGLVQLWDVGGLEYDSRPDSRPVLAYGLAQDKGFVWHLKWCPAGGWEPPSCGRKAPFLPRLGLLAVATSTGVVTIYSLPHPDALRSSESSGRSSQQLPIYQAEGVLTLKLGSSKAPREQKSGQVLSMDWQPQKPHGVMAVGFYDGVVGLWDLSTESPLLRVREQDGSLSLLPYRCFVAHDHAVRALAFCPASRHLLVTAGEDRYVKTWDLRRLYDPITVQKRYLTNEIYWPLNAPGLIYAQDTAYVAKGSQGVHYFDHYMRSIFAVPRTGTLWSISYTDWLNSVVTSDNLGEVILALLPQLIHTPPYLKRTLDRRFPVYVTSLAPRDTAEEESRETGGAKEEEGEEEERRGGETEEQKTGSEEGGGDESGREGEGGGNPPLRFQTYREAARKYCVHLTDSDLRTFAGSEKRAVWRRMKASEVNTKMNLDEMPLAALHKVRFNPNMSCHTWVASAGQTGLVRLSCLRSMTGAHVKTLIRKNRAQFHELYSPEEERGVEEEEEEEEGAEGAEPL